MLYIVTYRTKITVCRHIYVSNIGTKKTSIDML